MLLLVVNHPSGATVLFTQRTAHLANHAGQISFPGGGCDEVSTPEGTALREAEEEVGVAAERIAILGRLPEYRTVTGFAITPVVGWAEPRSYRPIPTMAEVFEVPPRFPPRCPQPPPRARSSRAHPPVLGHAYGERFIWGPRRGCW